MNLLEVTNVSKRFGGLTANEDVTFTVEAGQIVGLIGPNGAGKSTVFNLIAGAHAASAGEVRFAGEPVLGLPAHEIAARGLMRTFQHNRPFAGMSVIDNVLVGAHTRFKAPLWKIVAGGGSAEDAEQRRRAEELVQFVGLGESHDAAVDTLSFGQGRLLEIARGLIGIYDSLVKR